MVQAHHVILTSRSPVFKAMLDGPMREGQQAEGQMTPIPILEMDPNIFR